ncbi:MAG: hypothetical protein FWD68_15560 [Alphaproteobacteria bacterium]|nr:hypothetical protein [Alphaproteobacteria bacterium]
MRSFLGLLLGLACLTAVSGATGESRIFILATAPHGPAPACIARPGPCGVKAAQSWCQSHDFSSATAWRRVDRDEITGEIPRSPRGCSSPACATAEYVAITCLR